MKNYVYVAVCTDDRGWANGPGGADECLWGCEPEDRIFSTAGAAWNYVRKVRDAGCWVWENDAGETVDATPALTVERRAVYEWLWGDHPEAVIDRVIDLHGAPIALRDMPVKVGRFLKGVFGGASRNWMRESARLQGASSATHTAAFIAARLSGRVDEIERLFAARGIDL
jgi:hypothetical protein